MDYFNEPFWALHISNTTQHPGWLVLSPLLVCDSLIIYIDPTEVSISVETSFGELSQRSISGSRGTWLHVSHVVRADHKTLVVIVVQAISRATSCGYQQKNCDYLLLILGIHRYLAWYDFFPVIIFDWAITRETADESNTLLDILLTEDNYRNAAKKSG